MHSQLIKTFHSMTSILGDASASFGNDGIVFFDFMSKLVASINGYVFIFTGAMICVYMVGLSFVGTVNTVIN